MKFECCYSRVCVVVATRAVACEGSSLTISCAGPDAIHIVNAHYGRLDDETCNEAVAPSHGVSDVKISSVDADDSDDDDDDDDADSDVAVKAPDLVDHLPTTSNEVCLFTGAKDVVSTRSV